MSAAGQLARLPRKPLSPPAGPVSAAFAAAGACDLVEAFELAWALPYGRNVDAGAPLAALSEGRGTCSTKHALLARLCDELNVDVELRIGIYEMTEANTPGVGRVLDAHGLTFLPEAHCFLVFDGQRIDVTRHVAAGTTPIDKFLYQEGIRPDQVGAYKRGVHRHFIEHWAAESPDAGGLSGEILWTIREECIAALSSEERP